MSSNAASSGSDAIRRTRPSTVASLSPTEQAARKKAQFNEEVAHIEANGILFDRCTSCDSRDRDCLIVPTRRARQRNFHCLECHKRARHCSHDDAGSAFRLHLREIREDQDLKKGSFMALKRKREAESADEQLAQERADRLAAQADATKRRELAVREDEAATMREGFRTYLALQEGQKQPAAAKPAGSEPIIEEVE